jgi:hypothetical protein
MHRCLCTSYKCNEIVDAAGERGNLVDARKYRNHQQADKNAAMRALATQAQEAILEQQEESLSNALKGMPMMDLTTIPAAAMPLPDNDRYNIDRTRRMVAHVSEVKEELVRLRVEAESVKLPANTQLDDEAIGGELRALRALRASGTKLQGKLTMISRRSKVSSVVTLRDETMQELKSLFELISTVELAWEAALDGRRAQRQDVAKGVKEYDSSILSQAFGQFE